MSRIHEQLRQRRKELGLKQADMQLRAGMSRQQYQRLEAGGNPTLDNLELIAQGLNMELMLVPREKRAAVKAVLAGDRGMIREKRSPLAEDPWRDLLGGALEDDKPEDDV